MPFFRWDLDRPSGRLGHAFLPSEAENQAWAVVASAIWIYGLIIISWLLLYLGFDLGRSRENGGEPLPLLSGVCIKH